MREKFNYTGPFSMGPDIDRDGEDDPEFDYNGRVLDWEASRNDPPEDDEAQEDETENN